MKKYVAAILLAALLLSGCAAKPEKKQAQTVSPVETSGLPVQSITPVPAVDILGISNTQYRINLFLANFTETKFYDYPCSDYEMLRFVREHCYYNNDGDIHTGNGRDYIAKNTVDEVMYKYFAITLTDNASGRDYYSADMTQSIHYGNQQYSYPSTPFAYNGYVGIATSMQQDSYGYYQVAFDVYYVDTNYKSEYTELYYLNSEQAKNNAHLSYLYSGEAVVQDYLRTNGKQSYQLITLKKLS